MAVSSEAQGEGIELVNSGALDVINKGERGHDEG